MPDLRRSVFFSFADRYASLALNLTLTAVLARILTPEEFGLYAIVAGVALMLAAMREFGVGAYLIQSRTVSREDLRTAFTIALIVSGALAVLLFLAARPVAALYGDPRLVIGLHVATLSFVFVPFSIPALALLRREMRFDKVALTTVSGACAQLATAVGLAFAGFGYLSLVLGVVANNAVIALAAASLCTDRSMYRPSLEGHRGMLAFGGWASLTAVLNLLHSLLPQMLLGRVLGFEAAGLLNRATVVCQMQDRLVLNAVQPVMLPLFSARVRDRRDLKDAYLRAAGLGLTVQWPFLVCLILLADPIVAILLGDQWQAAGDLLRLLAVGYASMFAAFLTYPVLVASGRVKDTCTASLISLPPSFAAIILASFWGLHATAATVSLCWLLQVVVALRFVRAAIGFTWREFFGALRPGAFAASCAAVVPAATIAACGFSFALAPAVGIGAGAGALAGWLVGLVLVRHPLLDEGRLWLKRSGRLSMRLRPART